MELECVKYHEKMESEQAACRHSGDYCQHRTSCMIVFIEKENKREAAAAQSLKSEKIEQRETQS